MGLAIAQCSLFALLAAATFAQCYAKHGTRNGSAHKLAKPRHAKDEILAGEDTPVWLARRHFPHPTIVYERLTYKVTKAPSIVKQSLDYWDSVKGKKGFRVRRKPKSNPESKSFKVRRHTRNDSSISFGRIKRKSIAKDKVLHPSVLVVMDYHDVHPEADKRVRWLTKEKILYALAFWGTVARSLRQIRNPRVSLRIAGIVITGMRHASPYLKENEGRRTLVRALPKMLGYWKNVAKKNRDFRIGSYDIIAHMTDIHPQPKCKKCARPDQQKPPVFCVASKGPPCRLPNKVAGFIIHDDFAFQGLYMAISRMPKIFGSSTPTKAYHPRKWTKEVLDPISTALRRAACMSAPKGSYLPGKPVAPILAGELFPSVKQCEAAGYRTGAWSCWHKKEMSHRSNCQYLACSEEHNRHEYCSEIGRTLDGTFCNKNNTKICLDEKCVKKKWATQWWDRLTSTN